LPANVLLQGSRLPRLRKEIGRLKVFATIRWVVGHVRRNMHANHLVGANSIPQDSQAFIRHEKPVGWHRKVRMSFRPVFRTLREMCVVYVRVAEMHHGGFIVEGHAEYDVLDV